MSKRKASNKLRAQVFRSLSEPDTLRVLEVLLGPLPEGRASQVGEKAGMNEDEAFAQLGVLRKSQLLLVRRVGPHNYYRVFDPPTVAKILESADDMLSKLEEMRRKGTIK
ncbi:MAG: ArsR/SmtB family transcription factor [Candidatus Hodarchaeota archaeon]